MDKLRAIKFFCRTVEAKSFTLAARELGVPQSVLSKSISALEADLQFTLFNRSTRHLSVSEAGVGYYDRCRQLLLDMDEAETVARQGTAMPTGTLRVGAHPVFQFLLCSRICEFLAANPRVNVEITHTNSPATLLEEGLDVVLRIGSIADSTFVARLLGSATLIACASPSYLDMHGRPLHPQQLSKHCAIIPGRRDEDPFTRWTFSKGEDREVVTMPVSVVLREGIGLAVTAIGGVGIVQIYDIAAWPYIEDRRLETILSDWSCGCQPVYAVIPSRRNVPAKVRAFIDFARCLVATPHNQHPDHEKRHRLK